MLSRFEQAQLDELIQQSRKLPRRRLNLNVHQSLDDKVQKLFIAMQPDSYVRPHRHPEPEKTELFMAIRGRFAILVFDNSGVLLERTDIGEGETALGGEIRPDTWHTVIALEDDSVFFEVKQGPYTPLSDKDFAGWAPAEQSPAVDDFLQWLKSASPGQQSPLA